MSSAFFSLGKISKMAAKEPDFPSFDFDFDTHLNASDEEMINACVEVEEIEKTSLQSLEPSKKKARFAEIAESELDHLVENAQAKNTKISTKWAVSVFRG